MPVNLSKMSEKELVKLGSDLDKEMKKREKSKRDQARKEAEAAAKKHGFKLAELIGGARASATPSRKSAAPAKYANPGDPSQTWSGRGRQPGWYKSAIAAGKDPKSMEI